MTPYIKISALLFCTALLMSCWSELDCLHCKECFFEEDCNLNTSSSSGTSSHSGLSSSSNRSSSSRGSSSSSSSRNSSSSGPFVPPILSSSSISSSSSIDVSSLIKCGDELYHPETQFCDGRNWYVYKYEKIGSKTWMTEDLKFKSCGESSCGLLSPEYNSMYYGPSYAESLCYSPEWELPSIDDFNSLDFDPNDHNFAYGGYYDGFAFKNKGSTSSLYLMDGTVLKVIQIQNTGTFPVENITNYGSEMHSIRCVKKEN